MIRAAIHGRIGSDPVQRETRNGKSMVTASVAVNVAKPTEEAATEWVSLVAFGAVGESLARHAKGDVITAMGPLTKSTFAGREGAARWRWRSQPARSMSARENGALRARQHDREGFDLLPGRSIPRRSSRDARRPQICPMTALGTCGDDTRRDRRVCDDRASRGRCS
jgi:single-strand DNA-binding protein